MLAQLVPAVTNVIDFVRYDHVVLGVRCGAI